MTVYRITLPWPPAKLSPNARTHWAARSKVAKAYRQDCAITVWDRPPTVALPEGNIPMTFTFRPPDKRHRDADNMVASFKSGQDGLADGLRINDRVIDPTYRFDAPLRGGAVVVEIAL